ncbi:MAG: 2-hydroxyacid dehydrogenase [Streptosporangiaceae bacterium]
MSRRTEIRAWVPTMVADGRGDHRLSGATVEVWDGGRFPPGVGEVEFYVPPFLGGAETGEIMTKMPRLRVVQTLTAGVEALRAYVPECVLLCNARGAHDASTAEWVVGAILGALHGFPRFAVAQHQHRWDFIRTDALADRTVLIVGYGSIGAAVERRLAGFEVEVLRVARHPQEGVAAETALPDLLPRADVVVVLVPITSETRGMVDARFLARMKDRALLVNAARGAVVDTEALAAELSTGRLRAALDVTDPEPLPSDHPLWRVPGLLLTPHVAGSTPVSYRRSVRLAWDQLQRYVSGQPLVNVISGAY